MTGTERIHLNILGTCKTIFDEDHHFIWEKNLLVVGCASDEAGTFGITARYPEFVKLNLITKLEVIYWIRPDDKGKHLGLDWSYILARMTQLKKINIAIGSRARRFDRSTQSNGFILSTDYPMTNSTVLNGLVVTAMSCIPRNVVIE